MGNPSTPLIKWSASYFRKSKLQVSTTCRTRKPPFKPVLELLENRLAPATITVTTSADDLTPNDGSVSFREAITALNAGNDLGDPDIIAQNPGPFGAPGISDMIHFDIPGVGVHTITLTSALPAITDQGAANAPVDIDASTQPGFQSNSPQIELDGAVAGSGVNGLVVSGGDTEVNGFVINRFTGNGILLDTRGGDSVLNCFVGTDSTGNRALSNFGNGILINGISSCRIEFNVISGNGLNGVLIQGLGNTFDTVADFNEITRSFIGTNWNGTVPLGNNNDGFLIETVGVTTGNGAKRNLIALSTICANGNDGISVVGAAVSGTETSSNFIGTNAQGSTGLGNVGNGISVLNSPRNDIGAGLTLPGPDTISGNGKNGILVEGSQATGNLFDNEVIGTNPAGTAPLGNALDGIVIDNASSNTIGDFNGIGLVISGNGANGIHIMGPGATGNMIGNAFIGVDSNKTAAIGNSANGIFIENAPGNTINGESNSFGPFNTISGNHGNGVLIQGAGATSNFIEGSSIGLAAPNLGDGIRIDSASSNTIQGANLIAGNDGDGIHITGTGAAGNIIQGNSVGLAPGQASFANGLGNKLHGIALEGAQVQNNLIGGTGAGQGNTIVNNGAAGVAIFGDPTAPVQNTGNAILGNSIFNNKGLGIDLVSKTTYPTDDGVTANTPGGPHVGPNDLQNFPILSTAIPTAEGGTTIYGSLNSIPATTFRIEFFANDTANSSGFGEGKTLLGFMNVTTDATGNVSYIAKVARTASIGQFISATATDPNNNTSEFSRDVVFSGSDLVGRAAQSGQLWVGQTTGSSFVNQLWTSWNPSVTWVDVVTGDFTGDGRTDIAGRDLNSGNWWVAVSNGSSFTNSLWTSWNPNVTWVDVQVGDFTGDGKADIVGRVLQTGQWWVAQSTGSSFTNSLWTTWNPMATWVDVKVGDFTGDGKADITGRWLQGGSWWTGISTGSSFSTSMWAQWNPNVTWVDVQVGDFNGDGTADIAARVLQSGQWWVGVSNGSTAFATTLWTTWNPNVTWADVKVGDFNGDGKDDIIGRVLQTGQWWAGISTSATFSNSLWSTWSTAVTWVDVQVGDFNGDGKSDITGRALESGQWWTGISNGSTFDTSLWASWSTNVTWVDVRAGDFA